MASDEKILSDVKFWRNNPIKQNDMLMVFKSVARDKTLQSWFFKKVNEADFEKQPELRKIIFGLFKRFWAIGKLDDESGIKILRYVCYKYQHCFNVASFKICYEWHNIKANSTRAMKYIEQRFLF